MSLRQSLDHHPHGVDLQVVVSAEVASGAFAEPGRRAYGLGSPRTLPSFGRSDGADLDPQT
jgi:hypothetical protein